MNYQSLEFLAFALVVLVLYFAVGAKRQKYILLLANLYFFASAGVENIPFVLITLIASFLVGKKMGEIYEEADVRLKECEDASSKKQIRADAKAAANKFLVIGLVIVLGQLILFKSWGMLSGALNSFLGSFMPLGVSYYTFMAISYMLDIYWKKTKFEKNIVPYAVFLSYFPHIIQGPINRYSAMGYVLGEGSRLNYNNVTFGLQLVLWGLFKKMIIADRFAVFANSVMGSFYGYAGSVVLVAGICSAFDLYCNFSGCVDIVRGFSQMLGIEMAQNFQNPFFSKSAAEFWRRWHITLGTFFKDYVFMPISISPRLIKISKVVKTRFGMRAGKAVGVVVPTAVVWLLTGLWHGTGMNYILWGIYWGILMILPTVFQPEIQKLTEWMKIDVDAPIWQIFRMVRTFFLFVIGRIISTSAKPLDFLRILKKIVTDFRVFELFGDQYYWCGLTAADFGVLIVAVLILWIVELQQFKGYSIREKISGCNIVVRWIIYYGLFFAIVIFGMYGPGFEASNFVYGNF